MIELRHKVSRLEADNSNLYYDLTRAERDLNEVDRVYQRNEQQLIDDLRMVELDVLLLILE